jgi:hypothetical protein
LIMRAFRERSRKSETKKARESTGQSATIGRSQIG